MTITFGEFKELLLRNLRSEADAIYPTALLWDGTRGALDAILPWVPQAKVTTLTATGTSNTLALPSDVYMLDGVYDQRAQVILERFILTPRMTRNLPTLTPANGEVLNWMEYPKGSLQLSKTPPADSKFDVYYKAYWPKPIDADADEFVFTTPDSVRNGLLYYAMAHCLLPSSAASAQLRQFNTRIDSGTPVDNVLQEAAKFFRTLFVDEMNRQPKYGM